MRSEIEYLKLRQLVVVAVAIFALALYLGATALADNLRRPLTPAELAKLRSDIHKLTWGWADAPLTGDDRPFAEARAKLDAQLRVAHDPSAIVAAYKSAAAANRHDALAQFRWAYACYSEKNNRNFDETDLAHGRPMVALLTAADPHCYNYRRLQVLIYPGYLEERSLDERLLKRHSGDAPVQLAYAETLISAGDDADSFRALKLVERIVAAGQCAPLCYAELGDICRTIGLKKRQIGYVEKSIAAYNQFLAHYPRNDGTRTYVVGEVTHLEYIVREGDH